MAKPTKVIVRRVRAADPGLAIELNLEDQGQPIQDSLLLRLQVTDQAGRSYHSSVVVEDTVTETDIQLVIPFGDPDYSAGQMLTYRLFWAVPFTDPLANESLAGTVFANSGKFEALNEVPGALHPGEQLQMGQTMRSPDDQFAGIMESDGNFCVYEQAGNAPDMALPRTDSSGTSGNGQNCAVRMVNGRVFVVNAAGQTLAASPANQADPTAALIINGSGKFALQATNGVVTQVSVSPANLP